MSFQPNASCSATHTRSERRTACSKSRTDVPSHAAARARPHHVPHDTRDRRPRSRRFGLRTSIWNRTARLAWSGGRRGPTGTTSTGPSKDSARTHPADVDGYRRYLAAASGDRAVLAAAAEPPTLRRPDPPRPAAPVPGLPTVFRWSRRSAASVMRTYFRPEALLGAGLVGGPMVWGVSPELPGTGLGALGYAMRHVARSGARSVAAARFPRRSRRASSTTAATVRTGATVDGDPLHADRVAGVAPTAPRSPRRSSCRPPTPAHVRRVARARAGRRRGDWSSGGGAPAEDGYESKIDAVRHRGAGAPGQRPPLSSTLTVTPTIAEMDRAAANCCRRTVIDVPACSSTCRR